MEMKRNNWTDHEINVAIAAYFQMYAMQKHETPFNKAELARLYVPMLNNRSKGSYEAKLMNISAVFVSLGLGYVKGYVPLGHAQGALAVAVRAALAEDGVWKVAA
jgi:hypothetical protein